LSPISPMFKNRLDRLSTWESAGDLFQLVQGLWTMPRTGRWVRAHASQKLGPATHCCSAETALDLEDFNRACALLGLPKSRGPHLRKLAAMGQEAKFYKV
jgi:hypothetical protein